MIIKPEKIVSCSSEHPDFPASNMLKTSPPGPWKSEKPGVLLTNLIFQLAEESCITGLDIGNYRSCIVIVTGSTSSEPDNWIPIVNHQFLTHDEATNNKFKDQVQLFTKKELNPETLKIKFTRIKVTCMQSANWRVLFGLSFIVLRTEVIVDMNVDVFGRFKMKKPEEKKNEFKEKYLRLFPGKAKDYKEEIKEKIKEDGLKNFNKRQEEGREPRKRPLLEKLEAGKADEVFGKKEDNSLNNGDGVKRTPFGDIVEEKGKRKKRIDSPSTSKKRSTDDDEENVVKEKKEKNSKKLSTSSFDEKKGKAGKKRSSFQDYDDDDGKCAVCAGESEDRPCRNCGKLPKQKPVEIPEKKKVKVEKKGKKPFSQLLDDVKFSLSGYVNPQRDEIRRKAIKMGAKYIADPNTTTNKCTHLICAFRNTPKSQQLKGHAKILSHLFIEECFDHEKRYPWRRYAMEKSERNQPESEDEIDASKSPARAPNPFDQDTDLDSDCDY